MNAGGAWVVVEDTNCAQQVFPGNVMMFLKFRVFLPLLKIIAELVTEAFPAVRDWSCGWVGQGGCLVQGC